LSPNYQPLLEKAESNKALVGVLGLGYVGLPLAVTFALKGTQVLGFEKSQEKCDRVLSAENYIGDVADEDLKTVVANGTLQATTDFTRLKECDAILICVPTPWTGSRNPIWPISIQPAGKLGLT
jgi:UDP-N-acetyl-D-glucosamine dehydrogenase